jgi:4-aminobutyrate aminotransferase/(S)-3-amino-2-methylpropionate transaminase
VSQDLGARAQAIGTYVLGRLRAMQARHPGLGDIRALGAMIGLEFVKDPVSKEPDPESVKGIARECFQHGLIILPAGIFDNVIRLLMPLVVTDAQLAQGMDILESACAKILG